MYSVSWIPDAADAVLDQMNGKYAIVMEAGKTIVVHEEQDPDSQRRKLIRSSFYDIERFHRETVRIKNKEGKVTARQIGKWWLNHRKARRFDRVVFRPNADVEGAYNLWRGFGVQARAGDCSLFHEHLKDNICSGNADHYEYVVNWLARMIQKPDKAGEVALVMRGGRGTGKGIFVRSVGKLLGQHFLHISNGRHLTGNFNTHLQDVVLLFSDEAFWAGDKAGESALKALITEPTILIEPIFYLLFCLTGLSLILSLADLLHLALMSQRDFDNKYNQ